MQISRGMRICRRWIRGDGGKSHGRIILRTAETSFPSALSFCSGSDGFAGGGRSPALSLRRKDRLSLYGKEFVTLLLKKQSECYQTAHIHPLSQALARRV